MTAMTMLRTAALQKKLNLSRATIYNRLNQKHRLYDPTFPRPIRLGINSVAWIEHEVDQWIEAQAAKRFAG